MFQLGKIVLYSCLVFGFALLITKMFLHIHLEMDKEKKRNLLNDKSYWGLCRLVETNIRVDQYTAAQNKLICGDIIENVSKSEYDIVMDNIYNKKVK